MRTAALARPAAPARQALSRAPAPLRGLAGAAAASSPAASVETAARFGHDFGRLAVGTGGRAAGAIQAKLWGGVIQRWPGRRRPADEDEDQGIELQTLGQDPAAAPDAPGPDDAAEPAAPVQAAAAPPAPAAAPKPQPLPLPKTPQEGLARNREMRSRRTAGLIKSLETNQMYGKTDLERATKASYRTASVHAAERTRQKLLADQERLRNRRRRPAAPGPKPPGHWEPIHG